MSETQSNGRPTKTTKAASWHFPLLFIIMFFMAMASVFFWFNAFPPVHFSAHGFSRHTLRIRGEEAVGTGHVTGPEDLVYDEGAQVIYTGCWDGWIKRVTVNESVADSVVQNWVQTGGRALGLALDRNGVVIVADCEKGLLSVRKDGKVEVLVDEVEGLKLKLTDGVVVAEDGTIYFTDASYKYSLKEFVFEFLERKAHGRLMSYHPSTNHTTLLASNLYFPNGVALSPDQQFLLFCETTMRRCRKYHIEGPKKGTIEKFIDDLPGFPDNIHYAEGHYWIGMTTGPTATYSWNLGQRYPLTGKAMAIIVKYVGRRGLEKKKKNGEGGVLVVNLEGKATTHYYDSQLSMISCGIKIGNHIYCGSLLYSFILRLDVNQTL